MMNFDNMETFSMLLIWKKKKKDSFEQPEKHFSILIELF